MEISFSKRKLAKTFNSNRELVKTYGDEQARVIQKRLTVLRAAKALSDFTPYMRPERCHELIGNRKGELSMDLKGPYR